MSSHQRLEALQHQLEQSGADALRLELVRRARNFKRSWVDMAEALTQVRRLELWESWGHVDFYTYCSKELLLTRATVDKLTNNYGVVREHAPQVIERDGIAKPIPDVDAVTYFAKVLQHAPDEGEEERFDELKQAVFDESKPVAVLRRTFNPVFFPKDKKQERIENLEKIRSTVRRLEGLLQQAPALDQTRVAALMKQFTALREEIASLIPETKAEIRQAG